MVRHSLRMMAGTFLSRVLGLAREVLTAALFGATRQLDAFLVAYTLANLSRRLLAEGALSAAFVPEFSRTLAKDGPASARSLARQIFSVLLAATVIVTAAGMIAAPILVRVMAPGFDAEGTRAAVSLTRLMFPFLVFISVAALAMGVLNSLDCFFVPAIAPALSNGVFIVFLAIVTLRWGVWGLGYAVLLGGVTQMVLQWAWSAKKGVLLVPAMPRRDNEALSRAMRLFLPYAAGLSLNQLIPLISRMLGSFLEEGAISVLNYADRVLQLPLGLFVIAISQAILPQLSRQLLAGEEDFFQGVREALRYGLFIVLPVALGMVLFSGEIIHLLFFRAAFGEWAWRGTAGALAMYSLGLPGMACSTILLRALYARGLPREAMIVTAFSVGANVVFSLLLIRPMGINGLALASSLAFSGTALLTWRLLPGQKSAESLFRRDWVIPLALGLGLMGLLLVCLKILFPYPLYGSILSKSSWMALPLLLGAGAYALVTWKAGSPEWAWIVEAFKGRKPKTVNRESEGP
jgi:putative peptidoglycan lipid II flippase